MPIIHLSQNKFTQVDAQDYDFLMALGRWRYHSSGYACLYTKDAYGKPHTLFLHRVILERVEGQPIGRLQVDHRNAVRLDNRRENLRLATASENQAAKRIQVNNTSGQKGIRLCRGKWDVRLRYYHRRLCLGQFADYALAAAIYAYAHRLLWGEFTTEVLSDRPLPQVIQDKVDQQIALMLRTVSPV